MGLFSYVMRKVASAAATVATLANSLVGDAESQVETASVKTNYPASYAESSSSVLTQRPSYARESLMPRTNCQNLRSRETNRPTKTTYLDARETTYSVPNARITPSSGKTIFRQTFDQMKTTHNEIYKDIESFIKYRYDERKKSLDKLNAFAGKGNEEKLAMLDGIISKMADDNLEVQVGKKMYSIGADVIRKVIYNGLRLTNYE